MDHLDLLLLFFAPDVGHLLIYSHNFQRFEVFGCNCSHRPHNENLEKAMKNISFFKYVCCTIFNLRVSKWSWEPLLRPLLDPSWDPLGTYFGACWALYVALGPPGAAKIFIWDSNKTPKRASECYDGAFGNS